MRRFWAWPSELQFRGVLGINQRNGDYVLPNNPRPYYPRVDDKLLTKQICQHRRIPVPETYAVIERHGDIRRFPEMLEGRSDFVVKPCEGSEGRGILVIVDFQDDAFVTSGGQRISVPDMRYHLSTVLSGLYSLGGQPDRAIVEQRIVRHPVFESVAVRGTPDIRIILYRGVPVMAMVRLPTVASRGKANLHQGAVAAGINLFTGITSGGVCCGRAVSQHPDTGASIEHLQVPFWEDLVAAAINLAGGIGLGYLGVDFVLDVNLGPIILEANARPGLAIQVANRRGLTHRLDFIDSQSPEMLSPERCWELIEQLAEVV